MKAGLYHCPSICPSFGSIPSEFVLISLCSLRRDRLCIILIVAAAAGAGSLQFGFLPFDPVLVAAFKLHERQEHGDGQGETDQDECESAESFSFTIVPGILLN